MGDDMYQYDNNLSSSQDEISLFLRQILLRSSSSSHPHNSNAALENAPASFQSSQLQHGNISAVDSTTSNCAFLSASGGSAAANVCSSSLGAVSENEADDYDCESEEGIEALAEQVPIKGTTSRGSSKRSRAAEVHNLSEKRRRSRINEKMKALQNLIPNSNKTDKASMLDEAIEYLKQLQLQVQMLSLRNGLSLHPMCFPEGLQPLQLSGMSMELSEENRSIPLSMTPTLHQEDPSHYAPDLPNKHTLPNQPSVPYLPYVNNNIETSFGMDSPILAHVKPIQPRRSSETRREDILQQHQQSKASHTDTVTNPLGGSQVVKELESGTLASVSTSFDMQTRIGVKDHSAVIMRNSEANIIHTSQSSR